MDWALVYGTLVRNTGWTFRKCGKQPANRVFEFLTHLAEYPTADAMMRGRYGIKPKLREAVQQGKSIASEIGSFMGPAQQIPDKLRDLVAWVDNPDSWKKK